MKKNVFLSLVALTVLSGCASFTGLDAKSDFACAAPEGFSCTSMTGVYANINNPDLPKGKKTTFLGASEDAKYAARSKLGADQYGRQPMTTYQDTGIPIRTQPQIMRIWVAPWQSADKTFYDQNYVYLVVDYGDWVLTHNKSKIISDFAPLGVTRGQVKPPVPVPEKSQDKEGYMNAIPKAIEEQIEAATTVN